MKILTPKEMVRIERIAYEEGAQEEAFMDAAGKGISKIIQTDFQKTKILLLCGKGNNAGDAYVAGIDLLHLGYSVDAIQIGSIDQTSPLCQKQGKIFKKKGGKILSWKESDSLPSAPFSVILDGLFGTGFHGEAREPFASLIKAVNRSSVATYAIDIPSGLNGETGEVQGPAIVANKTIFLALPKRGFFLREGWNYVGKLQYVFFGLKEKYIHQAAANFHLLLPNDLLLPKIFPKRHKYQAGSVSALAGSSGMPGAAMLSSLSALRSGAGIVHLLHPEGMEKELSCSPYELVKIPYGWKDFDLILERISKSSACLIGPGIGLKREMEQFLDHILPKITVPCVLDADALNLIAKHNLHIPSGAILTPHLGEMGRLLGKNIPQNIDETFLNLCQKFADNHQCTVILKGGPTFIFEPGEIAEISPWGDPGMATAGCGDVLTGVLASFLAQGLSPKKAAQLGVYFHGKSGEIAAKTKTSYCTIASDLIAEFPQVVLALQEGLDNL